MPLHQVAAARPPPLHRAHELGAWVSILWVSTSWASTSLGEHPLGRLQDCLYWNMSPGDRAGHLAATHWVALDDVDEENGTLFVLPDRYRMSPLAPPPVWAALLSIF